MLLRKINFAVALLRGLFKAAPQKDNEKLILRISEKGSAEIRRPFFLRTSEKGAKSRLTVLAPAI